MACSLYWAIRRPARQWRDLHDCADPRRSLRHDPRLSRSPRTHGVRDHQAARRAQPARLPTTQPLARPWSLTPTGSRPSYRGSRLRLRRFRDPPTAAADRQPPAYSFTSGPRNALHGMGFAVASGPAPNQHIGEARRRARPPPASPSREQPIAAYLSGNARSSVPRSSITARPRPDRGQHIADPRRDRQETAPAGTIMPLTAESAVTEAGFGRIWSRPEEPFSAPRDAPATLGRFITLEGGEGVGNRPS